MSPDGAWAIGIECASARTGYCYVALDAELRVLALAEADLDDLLAFLDRATPRAIAINAPSKVNAGIVRKRAVRAARGEHSVRGADIREAEHDLRGRGILVAATPGKAALCAEWMRAAFSLYAELGKRHYKPFPADGNRQWLETHPQAGFCAVLGSVPLPKTSIEGRLQRALLLFERGVRLDDPMGYFEEITRHRLLHGVLPLELVPAAQHLDALIAAYTAWLSTTSPEDVSQVGNAQEGSISLPSPTLLPHYEPASDQPNP
jgi:hypothetical protein